MVSVPHPPLSGIADPSLPRGLASRGRPTYGDVPWWAPIPAVPPSRARRALWWLTLLVEGAAAIVLVVGG
jgi:hypothetical protein